MRRPFPTGRLDGLADTALGLSDTEVAERQLRYGANDILSAPAGSWKELLRDTARDPMLWFLLGTSALYSLLGDTGEAMVLLVALVPFLCMDAYLHRRTQASTSSLSGHLATRATVLRNGRRETISAAELVPGDLIEIAAGEYVPADAILCAGEGLQVDESALTGEAFPVRKQPSQSICNAGATLEDAGWMLAGTRVLTGSGRLRIAYTGAETLYGEIVRSALRGTHARTPLQGAIGQLVSVLIVAATALCILLAFIRWQQGHGALDALLSAVTLAVAALPEEFPIVFTFFLGVGVYRLARRRALVRRAVVVENIGRVTTICSDKTGTLTEGRLKLSHWAPAADVDADQLLRIAAAACDPQGQDALDVAVLAVASAGGGQRVARFPFTEDRKRETAILQLAPGRLGAYVKGAPETVLGMTTLASAERSQWDARIEVYATTGHKVIACASLVFDEAAWRGDEPDHDYAFAGLLAFEDPVRDGVKDAIATCRRGDIRVLMVTGDHPLTAAAIGSEIGLADGKPVVVEADTIEITIRDNPAALRDVDVVARAVPSQKLAIVRALQALGEIVAVTGDGVNDVPALQAADIGIAMGNRGTQSAREVAAIVLTDDNFSSIVDAVAEGQQLFSNLKLSFAYLLMIHLPLVLSAALVPLAGYPLLYLPIHIVWLELVIHPTALLVFQELPGDRILSRRHGSHVRFFAPSEWLTIAVAGVLLTLLLVKGYDESLGAGHDVEHARAMVVATLCIASCAITAVLSRLRTLTALLVICGTLSVSASLIQAPFAASRLHVAPLHLADWIMAATGGIVVAAMLAFSSLASRSQHPKP